MLDETGSVRAQEPILLLAAMEIDGRVSSESGQDSDEYLTMMEILQGTDGGSPPLTVVDLLKEAYGEHPVMCGDTDEASGQPKETVLTYKELQGIRARYDYAFWVAPPNVSPSTAKIAQTQNNKASPVFGWPRSLMSFVCLFRGVPRWSLSLSPARNSHSYRTIMASARPFSWPTCASPLRPSTAHRRRRAAANTKTSTSAAHKQVQPETCIPFFFFCLFLFHQENPVSTTTKTKNVFEVHLRCV